MLKLGEKIINQIYLGDKKIAKVFWGDKLVYQSGQPIFLDYIEFDGASYIDTLISEKGGTWTVTASGDKESQLRFLIGNGGSATQYFGALANGYWGVGTTGEDPYFDIPRTEKITVDVVFEDYKITSTIDGVVKYKTGSSLSTKNFLLCGYDTTTYMFKGNVYGCSYTSVSENLVLDLRPCIHPNGTVCFYDMVTKKYFYNQGTGELKAGGRFVKSILFDGASYIDTGIKHQTCEFETRTKFYNIGERQLQGYALSSAMYWECRIDGRIDSINNTNGFEWNKINIIYDTSNTSAPTCTTVVNDEFTRSITGNAISSKTYVFGCCQEYYWMQGEVEYHKTYINGELIQDLRPYVDENGKAYFKDLVTGDLFYNKGTGTLTYTE